MNTLKGNAVVAQSGGPTAVTNSSACGVIEAIRPHADLAPHLHGANNGRELGVKARYNKLGTCQRNAIHFAARTDRDEAYRATGATPQAAMRKLSLVESWA